MQDWFIGRCSGQNTSSPAKKMCHLQVHCIMFNHHLQVLYTIYTFTSLSINISQPKKKIKKLDFKNPNLISELNGTTFVKKTKQKQKTSIIWLHCTWFFQVHLCHWQSPSCLLCCHCISWSPQSPHTSGPEPVGADTAKDPGEAPKRY